MSFFRTINQCDARIIIYITNISKFEIVKKKANMNIMTLPSNMILWLSLIIL